jgi:hypothetical protein
MKVDQFFDVDVACFRDDFVAFASEEGEEGEGAGLVLVPAGVCSFEADVGAGGPAFGIDADLFSLLVVHAGHMFHFIIAEDYDQLFFLDPLGLEDERLLLEEEGDLRFLDLLLCFFTFLHHKGATSSS